MRPAPSDLGDLPVTGRSETANSWSARSCYVATHWASYDPNA